MLLCSSIEGSQRRHWGRMYVAEYSLTKKVALVFMAAVDAATMPQQKMRMPSHVGAPTFVIMRLLGTWNMRYPREKMPAAGNAPERCMQHLAQASSLASPGLKPTQSCMHPPVLTAGDVNRDRSIDQVVSAQESVHVPAPSPYSASFRCRSPLNCSAP